jgi:hypothetical protein
MAFHQTIQTLLLVGVRLPRARASVPDAAPSALQPLIDALAAPHRRFNLRAIDYGHRYRSAFWSIYVLSAIAVLCAVLPLAMGWDDVGRGMADVSVVFVLAELAVIGVIGLIFWRGHRHDWQGEWLAARAKAELVWYLPLIAPWIDFDDSDGAPNWYVRLFESERQPHLGSEIDALCRQHGALAERSLGTAWSDPQFIHAYGCWARSILDGQRQYHQQVARRQHALQHRVHAINGWLFGLTALAAASHLFVHARALSLATTFFPALGAALHGALAQSEAYRLESNSKRLAHDLDRIIAALTQAMLERDPRAAREALKPVILTALTLILDEHKDWHMLVQPHHLPLA